jgi:hypothetical protein
MSRLRVKTYDKEKGDRKVDTWYHQKSGMSCDICIRGVTFYAHFLEHLFQAPDATILKRELTDYAEHWLDMVWHGVIEIDIDKENYSGYSRDNGEKVSLDLDRYYLSISPAGKSFKVSWDTDEDYRKADMEAYTDLYRGGGYGNDDKGDKLIIIGLPLKAPVKLKNGNYLLPYEEATWIALKEIESGIVNMRKKLKELVSTKAGVRQLLEAGAGFAGPMLQGGEIRTRTRMIANA